MSAPHLLGALRGGLQVALHQHRGAGGHQRLQAAYLLRHLLRHHHLPSSAIEHVMLAPQLRPAGSWEDLVSWPSLRPRSRYRKPCARLPSWDTPPPPAPAVCTRELWTPALRLALRVFTPGAVGALPAPPCCPHLQAIEHGAIVDLKEAEGTRTSLTAGLHPATHAQRLANLRHPSIARPASCHYSGKEESDEADRSRREMGFPHLPGSCPRPPRPG